MRMNMQAIISEQIGLKDRIWKENLERYSAEHGNAEIIKKSIVFAKHQNNNDSPKFIKARIAIFDPEKKIYDFEKYVMLQSYYYGGKFGTIDLVKLPLANHSDIIFEYLSKILTPEISRQRLPITKSTELYMSRFFISGGLIYFGNDKVALLEKSRTFDDPSSYATNDIAGAILKHAGFNVATETAKGSSYIEECLSMMGNSSEDDFCERVIKFYLHEKKGKEDERIVSNSIFAMTAYDSVPAVEFTKEMLHEKAAEIYKKVEKLI